MTSAFRPSDVYGPPGQRPQRRASSEEPERPPRRHPWPVLAGAAVLAVVAAGVLAAPDEVGEGGIPPAVVDVVSEDQAIAALALHRAQAEAREALAIPRSVYAPPGPSPLIAAADAATGAVRQRLLEARAVPDPDPTVGSYWRTAEHDAFLEDLERVAAGIHEINLLAAAHDSIYDGAGAIPLPQAEAELTSRYLTGTTPEGSPLAEWGRALLAELDGADDRGRAEAARVAADDWWRARAEELQPPATDRLRAYLGGLPDSTLTGLEGHPLAGPGLARLRAAP